MKFEKELYQLSGVQKIWKNLIIMGGLVLILSALGLFFNSKQFFYSYLVAWVFWVSLGLGALFFVMLNHLTGAVWGIVLRRLTESVMMVLPYMFILAIPIFIGMHELYNWSNAGIVAADPLLQKKAVYLNVPFFVIRTCIYFLVWFLIAKRLYKASISQDQNPGFDKIQKMRRTSGPGMVLFALTTSFAAFDWLMSLDPHWYSTIFGVYVFSGGLLGSLALFTLIGMYFKKKDVLAKTITIEHYHDLAKLILSFTIFWAYMAFSQYFLIWYANIPEETVWFLDRWKNSWKTVSILLIFGHFLLPFVSLIFFNTKRNRKIVVFFAFWMFFFHYVDMYWLIIPTLHHESAQVSWMDLTTFFGIGGIFIALFWKSFTAKAI
ncbi:MAG: hypothetical protein KAR38_06975, partial [Calditrichia bacterium]|nr:hypothetical protein [Calditrichia bacterium]